MILIGDCLVTLPTLAEKSVQCCVTSPPYFGLRDYGVEGQHGLERIHDCHAWALGEPPCDDCFVCRMRKVFAQVHRVLKDDGTLWLNLGDSTASSGGNGVGGNTNRAGRQHQQHNVRPINPPKLKPKNLLGIPWRVALALQADGWILRQDIIWHKKTPMPETAKDRPTRAHEYLFLLVKQRRYYYDHTAIKEPCSPNTHARMAQDVAAQAGSLRANGGTDPRPMKAGGRKAHQQPVPSGWDTRKGSHRDLTGRYSDPRGPRVKNNPGFDAAMSQPPKEAGRHDSGLRTSGSMGGGAGWREEDSRPRTRNKRSVWTLGPEPFKGAHFATFPESLVRPCILAGTRPGDTVLDCYLGSGTTAAVAQKLGRQWIGCELSPTYTQDIAEPRLRAAQPGLAF